MKTSRLPASIPDDAVILEFRRAGAAVRISALDPRTLAEVVLQGPASAGEAALREAALAKLRYVLRGRAGAAGGRERAPA